MTKTTTKTTPQATGQAVPASATVELIDPATAVIDDNIRTIVHLDPAFVAQITSEGVRVPVLARRDDDGIVRVWDGQRRLLAAREAGLTSILAVFGTSDASKVARITDQLTSFNRDDLGTLDRITAYEQLALEGISVERIAKTTGTDKDTVAAGLTLVASENARQSLNFDTLSMDVAIYLAEFADDTDAMQEILDAADQEHGEGLAFVAQAIRDDKAIAAYRATVLAAYAEQGIPTFTQRWSPQEFTPLHMLSDAPEDSPRPEVDADTHTQCTGHALSVLVHGLQDEDTETIPVCTTPEQHHPRYPSYWNSSTTSATSTDAPDENAAEAKRVERRRVIANNKAWDTATTVRRDWLGALVNRKALPKQAAQFLAATLTAHKYELNNSDQTIARNMLGVTGYDGLAQMVEQTPTKAAHVSLAVALGAREQATSRESWRHPQPSSQAYFLQLEAWGYSLSDVERIAAKLPDTES